MTQKVYLGDGAYAAFDGWSVVLTAENGIHATDTIVLEPEVMQALLDFIASIRGAGDHPGAKVNRG